MKKITTLCLVACSVVSCNNSFGMRFTKCRPIRTPLKKQQCHNQKHFNYEEIILFVQKENIDLKKEKFNLQQKNNQLNTQLQEIINNQSEQPIEDHFESNKHHMAYYFLDEEQKTRSLNQTHCNYDLVQKENIKLKQAISDLQQINNLLQEIINNQSEQPNTIEDQFESNKHHMAYYSPNENQKND